MKKTSQEQKPQGTLESVANENLAKASEYVEDLINNDAIVKPVATKLSSHLEQEASQFLERHPDKLEEYAANPEILRQDIEADFPIIKYVDITMDIVDGVLLTAGVLTVIGGILTGGVMSAPGAALLLARTFMSRFLKKIVQKQSKKIIVRVATKVILKQIAKKGASNLGKYFLKSATYNVLIISALDLLLAVGKDVSATAIKNIIIDRGVSDFHLPRELVDRIAASEESAVLRILSDFRKTVVSDLEKLFTTEKGFARLAFGTAFSALLGKKEIQNSLATANYKGKLGALLQDKKYFYQGFVDQLLQKNEQSSQDTKKQEENKLHIEDALKTSRVPMRLRSAYTEYLNELSTKDPTNAQKATESKLHAADLLVDQINDELLELGVLDFIKQYMKRLSKDQIDDLLSDVVDVKGTTLTQLFERTDTANLEELIQTLRKNKIIYIEQLVRDLSLGRRNKEFIELTMKDLIANASLDTYKQHLARQLGLV